MVSALLLLVALLQLGPDPAPDVELLQGEVVKVVVAVVKVGLDC